jgi:hypothetical protein
MPRGLSRSRGSTAAKLASAPRCSNCPDWAAADKFWNEGPFARNGGYQRDARITRWLFGD